jgi:hypothetical protein
MRAHYDTANPNHTTVREHMPSSPRRFADWTPESLKRRAGEIGRNTSALLSMATVGTKRRVTIPPAPWTGSIFVAVHTRIQGTGGA